jgi:hypothetical protein
MAIDFHSTIFMEGVIREKPVVYSFLKDRYFRENSVFNTKEVYVDYDDGEGNLIAPFVIPRTGKVPMGRSGYGTYKLQPAYIAPSRVLTMDVLENRMAGEHIMNGMTPAERERYYVTEDLEKLDKAITRREEWMCAETMLDNACTMKHIGDRADLTVDLEAKFYDGKENPGVFKPTEKWDIGTETKRGSWYNEVCRQIESMTSAGRPVTDLVVGGKVAELILSDPWAIKILDNRRIELGSIDPRWQENGTTRLGVLNFDGVDLEIFKYNGTYEEMGKDGKKVQKLYLPSTAAILAAANTGKIRYGAVTQMEMDGVVYTRTGARVPKYLKDPATNKEETVLTAAPVAAPKMKGQWRACRDVFTA